MNSSVLNEINPAQRFSTMAYNRFGANMTVSNLRLAATLKNHGQRRCFTESGMAANHNVDDGCAD
jgi:hypothetical protein